MKPLALIAVFAAALGAAGCYTMPPDRGLPQPVVRAETVRVNLEVDAQNGGLRGDAWWLMEQAAAEYRSRGRGPLVISFPRDAANSGAALSAAGEARAFFHGRGVDSRMIAEGAYDARGMATAPVMVSFMRYVAEAPEECDAGWTNLAFEADNRAQPRFGCFMAANLAAQIGDAYDLVEPRDSDAPDSARRATVLERYRAGESTASQRSEHESGAVSSAVGRQ
ncbi:MAG: pilus assembly protein CpaD [Maricaulaceae bacterium]|nr:pilus assembly protein CpaD [Maricaulaceae bacterium]